MNLRILTLEITFIFILSISFCIGQNKDSIEKDSIKNKKNVRFSILGGPGYTPDYGFLIGGSALFTFSVNPKDSLLKRSVLPISFAYMTEGGESVIIRPQLFFNSDRFRIFGRIIAKSTLDNYFGVGYEENSTIQRGEETTQYRSNSFRFNPDFLFRFKQTNVFYGVSTDLIINNMRNPSIGVQEEPNYVAQGGSEDGLDSFSLGLGVKFSYDTRDVPANAYKGMLLELNFNYYSTIYGSDTNFGLATIDYRQFKELHIFNPTSVLTNSILAWTVKASSSFNDVPVTELPSVGSPFDLRGYYLGQYRDHNSILGVLEFRQKLNFGDDTTFKKLLSRLGFATWAGVGAIGPNSRDWAKALPNYGLGLRIEVQPRMNFRIDFGKDPISGNTLMYFNMTEAF